MNHGRSKETDSFLHRYAFSFLGSLSHASLIQNGSFEQHDSYLDGVYTFKTVNSGTAVTGWTIGDGGIDYIQIYWQAGDGIYSIDLSGDNAGLMAQSFNTSPGQSYTVTFLLAGNPDSSADKQLQLTVTGSTDFQSALYTFQQNGWTKRNMGWTPESFTFTAVDSSYTLEFKSLNNNGWGPALDKVEVIPLPPPSCPWGAASWAWVSWAGGGEAVNPNPHFP
jgi:choice-of-anchor C domain-containing protein